MEKYFTKDVTELFTITKEAVRYYEKIGFILPRRDSNNYRIYTKKDVNILTDVILLKKLGFSLKSIKKLIDKKDKKNILRTQIFEIQKQISDLQEKEKLLKEILEENLDILECKELLNKIIK